MTPKTLISIDGGGIRGLIALYLLKAIEKEARAPVARRANVFAGTSTGGLIALGLASGLTIDSLIDLYRNHATTIFSKGIGKKLSSLFGLADEQYQSKPYEDLIKQTFGDKTLRSLKRNNVVITSTNITTRQLHLFSSFRAKNNEAEDYPLWYAARATSAAPTYFEPAKLGDEALVDGGLLANNPALVTTLHIKSLFGWDSVENLRVLSIGTGEFKQGYSYNKAKSMGVLAWAAPISATMMQASSNMDDFSMRYLYEDMSSYMRLQPELHREIALDSVSKSDFKDMEDIATQYIKDNKSLITAAAKLLNGA